MKKFKAQETWELPQQISNEDINQCEKMLKTCLKRALTHCSKDRIADEIKYVKQLCAYIQTDIETRIEIVYAALGYASLVDDHIATNRVTQCAHLIMLKLFTRQYISAESLSNALQNPDLLFTSEKNNRILKIKLQFFKEKMQKYLAEKLSLGNTFNAIPNHLRISLSKGLEFKILEYWPLITADTSNVLKMFFTDYYPEGISADQEEKANDEKKEFAQASDEAVKLKTEEALQRTETQLQDSIAFSNCTKIMRACLFSAMKNNSQVDFTCFQEYFQLDMKMKMAIILSIEDADINNQTKIGMLAKILYDLLNEKYETIDQLEGSLETVDYLCLGDEESPESEQTYKRIKESIRQYFENKSSLKNIFSVAMPLMQDAFKSYSQELLYSNINARSSNFFGLHFSEYCPDLLVEYPSIIKGSDEAKKHNNEKKQSTEERRSAIQQQAQTPVAPIEQTSSLSTQVSDSIKKFESLKISTSEKKRKNNITALPDKPIQSDRPKLPSERLRKTREDQSQARRLEEERFQKRKQLTDSYKMHCENPLKYLENQLSAVRQTFVVLNQRLAKMPFPDAYKVEQDLHKTLKNTIEVNIQKLENYNVLCSNIIDIQKISLVIRSNDFESAERMISEACTHYNSLHSEYQKYESEQPVRQLTLAVDNLFTKHEQVTALRREERAKKAKMRQLQQEENRRQSIIAQIEKLQPDYSALIIILNNELEKTNSFLSSKSNHDAFKETQDLFNNYKDNIDLASQNFSKVLPHANLEINPNMDLWTANLMLSDLTEKMSIILKVKEKLDAAKKYFTKNIFTRIKKKILEAKKITEQYDCKTKIMIQTINSLNIPFDSEHGKQLTSLKEQIEKEHNDLNIIQDLVNKKLILKNQDSSLGNWLKETRHILLNHDKKSQSLEKVLEYGGNEIKKIMLDYRMHLENRRLAALDPNKKDILEISQLLSKYATKLQFLLKIKEEDKDPNTDFERQVASLCIKQGIVRLAQICINGKYHTPNRGVILDLRHALVHYSGEYTSEYFCFLSNAADYLYKNIDNNLQNAGIPEFNHSQLEFLQSSNAFTSKIFDVRLEQFINIYIYYTGTVFKTENEKNEVEQAFSSSFAELIEQAKKMPGFFDDGYKAWIMNLLRNKIVHPGKIEDVHFSQDKVHEIITFFNQLLSIESDEGKKEEEKPASPKALLFHPAAAPGNPWPSPRVIAAVSTNPVRVLRPTAKIFVPRSSSH